MKKEQAVFLLGGIAFGFLFGFGVYHAFWTEPDPARSQAAQAGGLIPGPQGPAAPTQGGPAAGAAGQAGAPMVAEINALKSRLDEDPADLAVLVRLANLHHDVGMWVQAAGYYERAIEVDSDSPDLLTDLGICYRGMGRFDDALAMFDRASGLDAQHWQALFNSVVVAGFDLGQFDRAELALETMERMAPPPPRLDELRQALEQKRLAAGAEGAS